MTGSNFWVNSFPAAMPGGTAVGQGGYGTSDALTARDPLDAKRMANGFAPGASYPDGYLGTITGRQDDKMLGALQTKLTSRSYQRGVHKGDKVGTRAYFWDADMDPEMGLEREAGATLADVEGGLVMMVPRFAPTGNPLEQLAHGGKTIGMAQAGTSVDPARADRLRHSLPSWSGGHRR